MRVYPFPLTTYESMYVRVYVWLLLISVNQQLAPILYKLAVSLLFFANKRKLGLAMRKAWYPTPQFIYSYELRAFNDIIKTNIYVHTF